VLKALITSWLSVLPIDWIWLTRLCLDLADSRSTWKLVYPTRRAVVKFSIFTLRKWKTITWLAKMSTLTRWLNWPRTTQVLKSRLFAVLQINLPSSVKTHSNSSKAAHQPHLDQAVKRRRKRRHKWSSNKYAWMTSWTPLTLYHQHSVWVQMCSKMQSEAATTCMEPKCRNCIRTAQTWSSHLRIPKRLSYCHCLFQVLMAVARRRLQPN